MYQKVSGEQDLEVDIEAGLSDVRQESTSADDISCPLIREATPVETSHQSLDLSEKKCDAVKFKKSRKASKPPRPPKSPCLSESDRRVMREIAELAMRKRERIERMKNSLRRIKATKSSSSPYINIFSLMCTVLFFAYLVFQGIFASNSSLVSERSPAPIISPNNQMVSAHFDNVFAPVEQTDPSPTTSVRYTRKRISGSEEGSIYATR